MDAILSIVVLCAIALLAGAAWLWRKGDHNRQAMLMLILAGVMIANVLVWTVPSGNDDAVPADRVAAP